MKDVVLVVLMLSQQPQPTSRAFTDAALEVLGPTARVDVEVVSEQPDDERAIFAAGGADGVVKLNFNADQSRVDLHCYIAGPQRWVDRSITFSEDDLAEERGRMLGFAVASMFTAAPREEPPPSAPEPSPPPESKSIEVKLPAEPRDEPIAEKPTRESQGVDTGLDFAGVVTTGLGGDADMLGASLAVRRLLTRSLWARVSFSGRVGELPTAQASIYSLVGGAGLAWTWFEAPSGFGASLRADLLASWLEVAHLSEDDPTVDRQGRWLAGGDLLLGGYARLGTASRLYAVGGIEGVLGKTDIYTHGTRVATIPVVRVVGEVGVESRF